MSKVIEFATEQTETEDTKKIIVVTETTQIVKSTSIENLDQEIAELSNQITKLTAKKSEYEAERAELIASLNITV